MPKDNNRMHPVQAHITVPQNDELKKLESITGKSKSEMIRNALDMWLNSENTTFNDNLLTREIWQKLRDEGIKYNLTPKDILHKAVNSYFRNL